MTPAWIILEQVDIVLKEGLPWMIPAFFLGVQFAAYDLTHAVPLRKVQYKCVTLVVVAACLAISVRFDAFWLGFIAASVFFSIGSRIINK
jgi:hypothetical protein